MVDDFSEGLFSQVPLYIRWIFPVGNCHRVGISRETEVPHSGAQIQDPVPKRDPPVFEIPKPQGYLRKRRLSLLGSEALSVRSTGLTG